MCTRGCKDKSHKPDTNIAELLKQREKKKKAKPPILILPMNQITGNNKRQELMRKRRENAEMHGYFGAGLGFY